MTCADNRVVVNEKGPVACVTQECKTAGIRTRQAATDGLLGADCTQRATSKQSRPPVKTVNSLQLFHCWLPLKGT